MIRLTRTVVAAVAALALGPLSACSAPDPGPQPAGARDVGVQMFQWTWNALGRECTDVLGPAGYGWVLTSPPQEHVLGQQWWTAYQPVSYRIESRLGTREEFAAMVTACHGAGVQVVADAVLNHMTGQEVPGVGWAGSSYSHYEYPGIWSDENGDFHHCGVPPADDISSYTDAYQVRSCELVDLADLATGHAEVRATLTAYLRDLLSLGVDGFRLDAAKHVPPQDLEAIVGGLPAGTRIVSEVIRGAGEPVTPEQYLGVGDVFEFSWGKEVAGMIRGGSLRLAAELGSGSGYLPSDRAWIFVENHDTERGSSTLGYPDGGELLLADVLALATDYGRPVLYSGYAFSDRDAGPPQDAAGHVLDASCSGDAAPRESYADGTWVCQHAWTAVVGMVGWRDAVGSDPVRARWDDGEVLALSRGVRGTVVLNAGAVAATVEVPTTLADGRYCDVIAGPVVSGACSGDPVEVSDGHATVTVPPLSAVALHVGARAGG